MFDNSFSINKAIYKNYTADSHVQDEVLKYYQGRYVTDNKVNQKFNDLGIRDKDKKENVARILCKQQDSELTEPTAIMSIIYRLRNKLFHGLKGVESFSGNKQLYEYANKFLLSCLECNKNV